jgi:hypothetical protein
MKRGIRLAIAATLGASLILFGGCKDTAEGPSEQAANLYAMGAVSTVKLLINQFSNPMAIEGGVAPLSYQLVDGEEEPDTQNPLDDYIEKFDAYLDILDSFFGDRAISAVAQDNDDGDYAYERKLVITGKDYCNETEDYTLYYTEGVQPSQFEEGKTNDIYSLDGIMNMYGLEITVRSERTYQLEEGQTSNKLVFRAYPYQDDTTTYIEMQHEYKTTVVETDKDFVYSVVVDGERVEQSSLKYEQTSANDPSDMRFKLTIQNGSGNENYEVAKQQTDEQVTLAVSYDITDREVGDMSGEFTVYRGDNGYAYSFGSYEALHADK